MPATARPDDAAYLDATRQARAADQKVRQALAGRTDVSPEILFFLAADTAAAVRQQIAGNPTTPGRADLLLASDAEADVRSRLLEKLIERIPPNDAKVDGPLETLTLQVLTALAGDRSPAIRRMLAAAMKDLEHAPYGVVKTLARDEQDAVAEPILRHSPQLTDDDLVEIVDGEAASGRVGAIARRPTVSHRVADAIAHTDDVEAIGHLLANDSAQIREQTLDHILAHAPAHASWHRPLVYRPSLPGSAIRTLASFVAASLVEVLQRRDDLDGETADAVADVVRSRIKSDGGSAEVANPAGGDGGGAERARTLHGRGELTEEALDEAIFAGDRAFVTAGLAALSGVAEPVVEQILNAQSARGAVAIVWKSGLSMRLSIKVQLQIARIPPRAVVNARSGVQYPMTEKEMVWQLEFFGAQC